MSNLDDFRDDQVVIPSLMQQLDMLGGESSKKAESVYFNAEEIDLSIYDHVVLAMSAGKDAISSLLHLIDIGFDMSKVELWHHDVDGNEGSQLMDWLFMRDYNRKLAQHFNIPLYFSWLKGGFEGEMLKQNAYGQPHVVETPGGPMTLERDTRRASPATRMRFPQQAASLQTRWCSSALKIDVARRGINNQPRFHDKNVLFISGERREESANRAKYNQLEPHSCDARKGRLKRRVDAWRPVLNWSEEQVWDALERHNILPPVPYRLGWSRSSCMTCIFNGPRIWATLNQYFPERVQKIADYENQFGTTISRKRINVIDVSAMAKPFEIDDVKALEQAFSEEYFLPIVSSNTEWELPSGAFSVEKCGAS